MKWAFWPWHFYHKQIKWEKRKVTFTHTSWEEVSTDHERRELNEDSALGRAKARVGVARLLTSVETYINMCMSTKLLLEMYIIDLTNRFHVAVRLFSNRSQVTSKCGKNKKVAHEAIAECVTDVLTTFWRLLWSITEQTHGNMESTCFI